MIRILASAHANTVFHRAACNALSILASPAAIDITMKKHLEPCIVLIDNGGIPEADPDISGKGVVLAFVLSAYITFLTTLVSYLCGLVDEDLLSSVDQKIFFIKPRAVKHPKAHAALRKAILALGDQQIVTGIAIMGAGFQGLRVGNISSYHFQIVLYLAWMSSSVHLSALTLLRSFLNRHKGLLGWRLCGMFALLTLLVVGLVPTMSNDWGIIHWPRMLPGRTGWGIPARCFWGHLYGNGISPDAVLSLVILFWSYVWKVGALFHPHRSWYNRWIRFPIENLFIALLRRPARRYLRTQNLWWLWAFRVALSPALAVFAIMEFFTSFAASIWLSALGLVFGTIQVEIPREQVLPYTRDEEDSWDFGQLVPLILLVQPIGAVCEHIWTHDQGDDDSLFASPQITRESDDSAPPSGTCTESLLHFVTHQLTKTNMSHSERQIFKSILFNSKLFSGLVWLVQAGLLTTFVFVFYYDATAIGYTRTHSWGRIVHVILLSIGTGLLATLVVGPFSRLGRLEVSRGTMLEEPQSSSPGVEKASELESSSITEIRELRA